MGFCKDCIYYGLVPDRWRRLLSNVPGCTLTELPKSDYNSCERFVAG